MKSLIPAALLVLAAPMGFAQTSQANPGEAFLHALDANGDGNVSRDEFVKPQMQNIERQFDYMDKNHDGKVDAGEADIFAKEMQKRIRQIQQQQK
jgi:Ca2+-binding EF-hand superfamily protein